MDNQAALKASENTRARPGSYIARYFVKEMRNIAKDNPNFNITICWSPGHEGIHGNEIVDIEAKKVATSREHNSAREDLPNYLCHRTLR